MTTTRISSVKSIENEDFDFIKVPRASRAVDKSLSSQPTGGESKIELKEEKKSCLEQRYAAALSVQRPMLMQRVVGARSGDSVHFRTKLGYVSTLIIPNAIGKYALQVASTYSPGNSTFIAALAEWSSFSAIFDEFFVHAVEYHYVPNNSSSSNSTAGSTATGAPGDLNTFAVGFYAGQHRQAPYSDGAQLMGSMASSESFQLFDSAQPKVLHWRNIEKYVAGGPLGDASTSTSTQSWLNMSQYSSLGGFTQWATAYPSGAAAGLGTTYETGTLGTIVVRMDITFRFRS
jgi:hypothetical protein